MAGRSAAEDRRPRRDDGPEERSGAVWHRLCVADCLHPRRRQQGDRLALSDQNNLDGGDSWVSQGYSIVEVGTNASNGHFHDLPAIAVDPVRTSTGDPCAHRVYLAWARFQGAEGAATLNFARTTTGAVGDGDAWMPTWDKKYVKTNTKTEQGVTLAVDPRPGDRPPAAEGRCITGGVCSSRWTTRMAVWVTSSQDFGANFGKATLVTNGMPMHPFDQPTISTIAAGNNAELLAFRSNSLPTIKSVHGTVFMAWQERVGGFASCTTPINPTSLCGSADRGWRTPHRVDQVKDGGATWTDYLAWSETDAPWTSGIVTRRCPPRIRIPAALSAGSSCLSRAGHASTQLRRRPPRVCSTSRRGSSITFIFVACRHQPATRRALRAPRRHHWAARGHEPDLAYPVKQGANLADGEQESDIAEVKPGIPRVNKRVNAPNSANGTSPFIGDYLVLHRSFSSSMTRPLPCGAGRSVPLMCPSRVSRRSSQTAGTKVRPMALQPPNL